MNISDIPSPIIEKLRRGEVILFLGAGASIGAKSSDGAGAPSATTLGAAISERFLAGKMRNKSLAEIAEFAVNESSLYEVQEFVASTVESLQPAQFHSLIAAFRWKAIFSTNYDLIVERAYAASSNPLQTLMPVVRQDDNLKLAIADAQVVPYIKLHGCTTVVNDERLPLILTSEQYANHLVGRERLFQTLQEWARDTPIVFCGYNLSDSNIQKILFDLGDTKIHRPMYVSVRPDFDEIEIRYWSSRRISPIKSTFKDFLLLIDGTIPFDHRKLGVLINPTASSIVRFIASGDASEGLLTYIEEEINHVYPGMPFKSVSAKDFYRGSSGTWGGIQSDYDVRRRVTDELLINAVLETEGRATGVRLFLLKGYAGSGKTITLRRVAWEAANVHQQLVLWVPSGSTIRPEHIGELARICKQHVLLIIDDCLASANKISELHAYARSQSYDLSIIIGARTNEWNLHGDELEGLVDSEFELRDLSRKEIDQLIEKLSSVNELGHLKFLDQDKRREYFELTAERQLLVALHEANSGKPFVEIVLDEFSKVVPTSARDLYLDVCTFHRYGVPIRAGLVSRLSGITLEYFREKFFSPLQHLVRVDFYHAARDYAYRTRHKVIASAVFDGVFESAPLRADQMVRVIRHMNVEYESDRIAFEQLVKGRELAEMFSDKRLGIKIFEAAMESTANTVHVLHQRAVYELNHPSKNATSALRFVEMAIEAAGGGRASLLHTKALAHKALADASDNDLAREHHLSAAKSILTQQKRNARTSHAHSALGRLLLGEIKTHLAAIRSSASGSSALAPTQEDIQFVRRVTELEACIREGLQHFPDDSHMLSIDSELAAALENEERATQVLEMSIEKNPQDRFTPIRLARIYLDNSRSEDAKKVLAQSISADPGNKQARLQLAKLLIAEGERENSTDIVKLLKACFSQGDTNYEARFWCARHMYLFGDRIQSREYFKELERARVSADVRNSVRGGGAVSAEQEKYYEGVVRRKHDSYLFVGVALLNDDVFCHHTSFPKGTDWESLRIGQKLLLKIGFTFRGPQAASVKV